MVRLDDDDGANQNLHSENRLAFTISRKSPKAAVVADCELISYKSILPTQSMSFCTFGFLIQEGTETTLLQVNKTGVSDTTLIDFQEGLYALVIIIHLFMGGDNNLGDDTPGASCVSCICSKNHKLSATDQATGSGGFHLLKQQELRKTQSGAQQRSHMFQQQRGSLRRNPKHRC
ncbi:hypothetical protein Bca4012_046162 [Brassica carinata]